MVRRCTYHGDDKSMLLSARFYEGLGSGGIRGDEGKKKPNPRASKRKVVRKRLKS